MIEQTVNRIIQKKEYEIFYICGFNLNQHCGYNIVDLILTLTNDTHDFQDMLGIISKLALRYMFQRCQVDRDVRLNSQDDTIIIEPR